MRGAADDDLASGHEGHELRGQRAPDAILCAELCRCDYEPGERVRKLAGCLARGGYGCFGNEVRNHTGDNGQTGAPLGISGRKIFGCDAVDGRIRRDDVCAELFAGVDGRRDNSGESLGFAETKSALEAGYRLCQSRGIKLVVLFVPIKVRVLEPYVLFNDQNDKDQYLPGGIKDSEKDFAHETAKFCEHLGCPFIDVTNALRRRASEDNRFVYMTNQDTHLDVEGHKVVAEALEKWLQDNLGDGFVSGQPETAKVK